MPLTDDFDERDWATIDHRIRGVSTRAVTTVADEMRIGVGRYTLAVRGAIGTSVLLVAVVMGWGYYHDQQSKVEHRSIAHEIRIQTCVSRLTDSDIVAMKEAARRGSLDVLTVWCSWLLDLDKVR